MNYLAHLYLADPDPLSWVGNLMGDFVKGPMDTIQPSAFRREIMLHRRIDAFTDAHPVVHSGKSLFRPPGRRYAGILLDMLYDHFLARDWQLYSSLSLREFSHNVYCALDTYFSILPPAMQRSVSHMIGNDLLMSYRRLDGIARALQGIERRLRRPFYEQAMRDLQIHYDSLEANFADFFPQLMAHVAAQKEQWKNQSS